MSFIEERPEVNEVYAKLIKAKKQFGKALRNANNPHFKSRYADLQSVLDAISVALEDNDLFVTQKGFDLDGKCYLKTLVFDSSGDYVDFGVLPIKTVKDDAQAFGSALTYARRYSLMCAFGLAPEDDDGAMASGIDPKLEDKRRAVLELGKSCTSHGYTIEEVAGALNGVKSTDLTMAQAIEGEKRLKAMLENAKKGQLNVST